MIATLTAAKLLASVSLAAAPVAPPVQGTPQSIVDTAISTNRFTTLVAALQATGLDATLQGSGPFTVFAPTDFAFDALGTAQINQLLQQPALLSQILTYHVVDGSIPASQVVTSTFLTTVNGQRVDITMGGGQVFVDQAMIQFTDIQCTNGVIHIIDAVLMPNTNDILDTAAAAGGFDTLATAVGAADLITTLQGPGPFTVFAPTDGAFAALPAGFLARLLLPINKPILTDVLTFHVVSGRLYAADVIAAGQLTTLQGGTLQVQVIAGEVFVEGSKVITADIEATNGNIHVIDKVLSPL